MMKKLLLSLFAAVMALGASAYETNQYVYTSAARYKLVEKVAASDFSNGTEGWTVIAGSGAIEDFGAVEEGAGPDGANEFKFSSGTTTNGFYLSGTAAPGTYLLTFKAKNADAAFTSVVTAAAANRVALVCNNSGDEVIGTDPVSSASTETVTIGSDWTDCAISVVDTLADNTSVVAILAGLPANTEIADVEVWSVETVYDTRAFGKALNYAELLMADENFNQDADALAALDETYQELKAAYDTSDEDGSLDDESTGSDMLAGLDEAIETYLNASSTDMSSILTGVPSSYWTGKSKYNRGSMGGTDFGGVSLGHGSVIDGNTDNNWQHPANSEYLYTAIQTGYTNRDQTWTASNANFPAGKYFMTCEMQNAYTGKSSTYVYTYTMENAATLKIGDTEKVVPLSGSEWTKAYLVGTVTEDGQFSAQVSWNNGAGGTEICTSGGAFFIKNCQVRAFDGENVVNTVDRKNKFATFKTQYDAAVSARAGILALKGDAKYPYAQNTIDPTVEKWDPYLNAVSTWIDADGNDTKVATTDELDHWAVLQGVYAAEDTVGFYEQGVDKNTYQYPVVRGYQLAANNIKNLAAHFTTLASTIETANTVLADPMYSNGDKETFKAAIAAAQSAYNTKLAAATDESYEADTTAVNAETQTLLAAIEAFKKSGELKPIINIDFDSANGQFTPVYAIDEETGAATEDIDHYEVAGVDGKGKMIFASNGIDTDNANGVYLYQLGKSGSNEGVLHMGNSNVYVPLTEYGIDPSNDVLKVEFDCYYGQLSKGYFQFALTNTESSTLTFGTNEFGGIKYSCYSGSSGIANNTIFATADGTLDNTLVYGTPSSKAGDNSNVAETNRTHYVLTYDLKAKTCKAEWEGKFTNGVAASSKTGYETTMPTPTDEDMTPKAMVFGCTGYSYADARRMWLDNVVIYQYSSQTSAGVKGDVTGDGTVDIADVNAIIAVICGGTDNASSADVTADSTVDIADVNAVIAIICGAE